MIAALLRRDLALLLPGGRRGGALLPLLFFLAVAMLYPFAVGPEPELLARTGGGVIWVAALLAAILPLERLVSADLEAGVFDQLHLRGVSEEWAMASRLLAHWLAFAPLLLLAALPAAALLNLPRRRCARCCLVCSRAPRASPRSGSPSPRSPPRCGGPQRCPG